MTIVTEGKLRNHGVAAEKGRSNYFAIELYFFPTKYINSSAPPVHILSMAHG
jgi:hypothetical protein